MYQCILSRSHIDALVPVGVENPTVYVFYLHDPSEFKQKMESILANYPEIQDYSHIELCIPNDKADSAQEGFFSLHSDRRAIDTYEFSTSRSPIKKYFQDKYRAVIKKERVNWFCIEDTTLFDYYINARYLLVSAKGEEFVVRGPLPHANNERKLRRLLSDANTHFRQSDKLKQDDLIRQMYFIPPEVSNLYDQDFLLKPMVDIYEKDERGRYTGSGIQIERFLNKKDLIKSLFTDIAGYRKKYFEYPQLELDIDIDEQDELELDGVEVDDVDEEDIYFDCEEELELGEEEEEYFDCEEELELGEEEEEYFDCEEELDINEEVNDEIESGIDEEWKLDIDLDVCDRDDVSVELSEGWMNVTLSDSAYSTSEADNADFDLDDMLDTAPVILPSFKSSQRDNYTEYWCTYTLDALSLFCGLSPDKQQKHAAGAILLLEKMLALLDKDKVSLTSQRDLNTIEELKSVFLWIQAFKDSVSKQKTLELVVEQVSLYTKKIKTALDAQGIEQICAKNEKSLNALTIPQSSRLLDDTMHLYEKRKKFTEKFVELFMDKDEVLFQDAIRNVYEYGKPQYLDVIEGIHYPKALQQHKEKMQSELARQSQSPPRPNIPFQL